MTAEQILNGLIPVDKEFMRTCRQILQQEALPTAMKNGLRKAMTKHGVYLYEYSRQPEQHDKALNSIMSSGMDILAILQACVPEGKESLIAWELRRELEGILISRAQWCKEYEERRKNGVVIFAGDGKTRVN